MAKRRTLNGFPPIEENNGLGQEAPVQNPGPMGAADQSTMETEMTPLKPLLGMTPVNLAEPGGGGENTEDLLAMLMRMFGKGQGRGL